MFHNVNKKLFRGFSLAVVLAMLLASLALADNVHNDVATTHPSGVAVIAGDPSSTATVGFFVQGLNGDGENGCNIDTDESLILAINTPSGVSASPSSVTFTDCDQYQYAVFSAGSGGQSGEVTLSITSNNTGNGTYNLNPAKFNITVNTSPPPSDTTAPVISYVLDPALPDGSNGWYRSDVTLTWTVSEPESPGSLALTGCVDQNITADQDATTYSCSATSDGGSAGPVDVTIKRDATPPTISGSAAPAPNGNGWNNSDVTVSFTCDDNLSGVASCEPDQTLGSEAAGQSATGTAVDNAGNGASTTVSGINIDKTAPTVALVDGPADGESYYFGFVPDEPTCSASDALSGLDGSCSVSGYSSEVGFHTVTASATDLAGNSASDSASYTVLAWTLSGFYNPVDMAGVWNTVKGGSTVPLKFEIFAGSTELTDIAHVKSFIAGQVACNTGGDEAPVEFTTTGGTSLRYDWTAGQFVQNWQTPKGAGKCYKVTMTTMDDSTLIAYFKTK